MGTKRSLPISASQRPLSNAGVHRSLPKRSAQQATPRALVEITPPNITARPVRSKNLFPNTTIDKPPDVRSVQGACSEKDRLEHIHDDNPRFIDQVKICSRITWAKKPQNVACIVKTLPLLSKKCACCFADMARCSLENCKLACMFRPKSERCVNCAIENCRPALIRCTGVAAADLL